MSRNKIILISFVVLVAVQWLVPASMIMINDYILKSGIELRLKIRPIDPHDPFRGKYISLYFEEDKYEIKDLEDWEEGQNIYVVFQEDSLGFGQIAYVEKSKPLETNFFVKAKISYIDNYSDTPRINIIYPFNRFYMEENRALEAEKLVQGFSDVDIMYAQIYVDNGLAVISDIFINKTPINEYMKTQAN